MSTLPPRSEPASPSPAPSDITTHPLLGICGVLLGAMIATCTGRLISVGLADLRGALHLGVDEASWIGTSFNAALMFIGPFSVYLGGLLGARIGREGLGIAMLDSTTWEEAVPHVGAWVRQRSRWIKGYLQTYLVHMRHPLRLLHQLGWRGFFDFQMLIGASALVLLLNPLMWALTAVYLASKGRMTLNS